MKLTKNYLKNLIKEEMDKETWKMELYAKAKAKGLSTQRAKEFVEFFTIRFPEHIGELNYTAVWITRYAEGTEWDTGDSESRKVLKDLEEKGIRYKNEDDQNKRFMKFINNPTSEGIKYATKLLLKEGIESFNSAEAFQKFLRKGGKAPDYVKVNNILFTMDMYDRSGKELTYGNKTKKKQLYITTSDRYKKDGMKDATVEMMNSTGFRNDVNYADENAEFIKFLKDPTSEMKSTKGMDLLEWIENLKKEQISFMKK